jgi:hypothetical protein
MFSFKSIYKEKESFVSQEEMFKYAVIVLKLTNNYVELCDDNESTFSLKSADGDDEQILTFDKSMKAAFDRYILEHGCFTDGRCYDLRNVEDEESNDETEEETEEKSDNEDNVLELYERLRAIAFLNLYLQT